MTDGTLMIRRRHPVAGPGHTWPVRNARWWVGALALVLVTALWLPAAAVAATQPVESRNLRVSSSTAGETIVSWRDTPGNATDWVSVVPVGTADDSYGSTWTYTNGQRSGSYNAGRLASGEYEARLYLNWPSGGYTVIDRLRFRVGPVDAIAPPRSPAQAGIEITVESLDRPGVVSRFTVGEQVQFCTRADIRGALSVINAQRAGAKVLASSLQGPGEWFCERGSIEADDVSLLVVLVAGADTFVSAPYPLR